MKNLKSLMMQIKKGERGASLIAVVVLMTVVMAIGAVATSLTVTTISMKVVERQNKNTFYDADSIMEELVSGIEANANAAYASAYETVMLNYVTLAATNGIDSALQQTYLENLLSIFTDLDTTQYASGDSSDLVKDVSTGEVLYATYAVNPSAGYSTLESVILDCVVADHQQFIDTTTVSPAIVVDYVLGTFTITGLRVVVTTDDGYESSIDTDLVISTPTLNMAGVEASQELTGYCIIADDSIEFNASNVSIDGSVYAGADGITVESAGVTSISITGDTILTRGDITANGANTSITIGSSSSNIWAENIIVDGAGSTMSISGTTYVSDDLEVNGKNSTVSLSGSYFGYNYSENYGSLASFSTTASYSSAIMINGFGSSVDLSSLTQLYVAGRSYISRTAGGTNDSGDSLNSNDIVLGESVTVRATQLAYFVPSIYNQSATYDTDTLMLTEDGVAYYTAIGVENVEQYLDSTQNLIAYYYNYKRNNNTVTGVNYYLNFIDEAAAASFFAAYYNSTASADMLAVAEKYMSDNGLVLNDGELIYTLSGNLLYRTSSAATSEDIQVIIGNGTSADTTAFEETTLAAAKKYKALQLTLSDDSATVDGGISDEDVRLSDKTSETMFEYLIDTTVMKEYIAAASSNTTISNAVYEESVSTATSSYMAVVFVDGNYTIKNNLVQGIVVATGDVYVEGDFEGLIICDGTVTFASNACVSSSSLIVTTLLNEDVARETSLYYKAFKSFDASIDEASDGTALNFNSYTGYSNWIKNKEY